MPDLSGYQSREEVYTILTKVRSDDKPKSLSNQAGQVWSFAGLIQQGDLVILPLKTRSAIAIASKSMAWATYWPWKLPPLSTS